MKYYNFLNQVSDLDIIFFYGNNCISKLIVKLESLEIKNSKWSHVGIVVRKKYLNIGNSDPDNALYVFESILSSKNKLLCDDQQLDINGNPFFGVQLRRLDDVVYNFLKSGGNVGWGKQKRVFNLDKLNEIYQKYIGLQYPINIIPLCALFPCKIKYNKKMFCSELVAQVLIDLYILPNNLDVLKITPSDLANSRKSKENFVEIIDKVRRIEL